MSRIGYTWSAEYREKFFSSEKVQEHQREFIEMAKQPKPPETREKMSKAKVGKKFDAQHRANMSETHKFRQALRKSIETNHPELPKEEVWNLVKIEMETSK